MNITVDTIRLRGARLLCDKVRPVGSGEDVKIGSLYTPAQSTRNRASYGMRAHVLRVGPGVKETIPEGSDILIDEFGGRPIWDDGHELPLWIVGESEVMGVLSEAP
jgi:hypothetical protein